jgi:hypothetical protein
MGKVYLEYADKVVSPVGALLLPGEYAGRVDHGDTLEDGALQDGALEAVEERPAVLGQRPELTALVHGQRVAGYDLFSVTNY